MLRITTRKSWFVLMLALIAFSLTACFDRESKEQSLAPYDDKADAKADIAAALSRLDGQQRLLIVFGANWCPDCRRIDASMTQPEIAGYLRDRFAVVKVDVGNFDKNMTLSEYYGLPTGRGIPAMALVDRQDEIVRIIRGKELATAHKQGREAFYEWLRSL